MSQQGDWDTSAAAAQPLGCNSDRYCLSLNPWAQPPPCHPKSGSPTNLPCSDLTSLPGRFYLFWISQLPFPHQICPLGSAPSLPAAPFRTPPGRLLYLHSWRAGRGGLLQTEAPTHFFVCLFFYSGFSLFCSLLFFFLKKLFKLFLGL